MPGLGGIVFAPCRTPTCPVAAPEVSRLSTQPSVSIARPHRHAPPGRRRSRGAPCPAPPPPPDAANTASTAPASQWQRDTRLDPRDAALGACVASDEDAGLGADDTPGGVADVLAGGLDPGARGRRHAGPVRALAALPCGTTSGHHNFRQESQAKRLQPGLRCGRGVRTR